MSKIGMINSRTVETQSTDAHILKSRTATEETWRCVFEREGLTWSLDIPTKMRNAHIDWFRSYHRGCPDHIVKNLERRSFNPIKHTGVIRLDETECRRFLHDAIAEGFTGQIVRVSGDFYQVESGGHISKVATIYPFNFPGAYGFCGCQDGRTGAMCACLALVAMEHVRFQTEFAEAA